MKFYTPEWIHAKQRSMVGFMLRDDERAARFDEAFYQQVYGRAYQREYDWMKDEHEQSRAEALESVYGPMRDAGLIDGETYEAKLQQARQHDEQRPPFDGSGVEDRCQLRMELLLRTIRRSLPEEILGRVADMRVLAAGVASPEVLMAIDAHEQDGQRPMAQWREQQRQHIEALWDRIPQHIQQNLFSRNGDAIEGLEVGEGTVVLRMQTLNMQTLSVCFEGCEVIQMDEAIAGSQWDDMEFDILEDGRYEVGIVTIADSDGDDEDENEWIFRVLELRASGIRFEREAAE